MACFREGEWERLDFQLLRDGPIVMYFREQVLGEDVSWLRAHGYIVDRFDARSDLLPDLARTLAFPE